MGVKREIVVGHDFRGYSASIKIGLVTGLMAAGCKVRDIGLPCRRIWPIFAQSSSTCPLRMVTASHNDNGWTGVKMGAQRPVTFGPDEIGRLEEDRAGADFDLTRRRLLYLFVEDFAHANIRDLTNRPRSPAKLRVIAACGNGNGRRLRPIRSSRSSRRGDPA